MTATIQEHAGHPAGSVPPTRSPRFPLDADGFTDLDLDAHLAALRRAADQAHAANCSGWPTSSPNSPPTPTPTRPGNCPTAASRSWAATTATPSRPGPHCRRRSNWSPCTTPAAAASPSSPPSPTSGPPTPPAPPNARVGSRRRRTGHRPPGPHHPGPVPPPGRPHRNVARTPTGSLTEGPRCWRGGPHARWTRSTPPPCLGPRGQGRLGPARPLLPLLERMTRTTNASSPHPPPRTRSGPDRLRGRRHRPPVPRTPPGPGTAVDDVRHRLRRRHHRPHQGHGLHDDRDHATRVNDALVDVLRDGLTRWTPAHLRPSPPAAR